MEGIYNLSLENQGMTFENLEAYVRQSSYKIRNTFNERLKLFEDEVCEFIKHWRNFLGTDNLISNEMFKQAKQFVLQIQKLEEKLDNINFTHNILPPIKVRSTMNASVKEARRDARFHYRNLKEFENLILGYDGEIFQCMKCPLKFNHIQDLNKHIRIVHEYNNMLDIDVILQEVNKKIIGNPTLNFRFKCPKCTVEEIKGTNQFRNHLRNEHWDEKFYLCPRAHCQKIFEQPHHLAKHIVINHCQQSTITGWHYRCEETKEQFRVQSNLAEHIMKTPYYYLYKPIYTGLKKRVQF